MAPQSLGSPRASPCLEILHENEGERKRTEKWETNGGEWQTEGNGLTGTRRGEHTRKKGDRNSSRR